MRLQCSGDAGKRLGGTHSCTLDRRLGDLRRGARAQVVGGLQAGLPGKHVHGG